jgi:uncharacterized membrane protein
MELVSLHLFALFLTAIVIVYSDHQGFLYFRGKKQTLSPAFLMWSHRLVWIGLLTMITTGVFLTIPAWTYRFQDPVFFVKMGFVLVLVVNAFAIGALARTAATTPFASLALEQKRTLLLSGFVSGASWVGAACVGYFFL